MSELRNLAGQASANLASSRKEFLDERPASADSEPLYAEK